MDEANPTTEKTSRKRKRPEKFNDYVLEENEHMRTAPADKKKKTTKEIETKKKLATKSLKMNAKPNPNKAVNKGISFKVRRRPKKCDDYDLGKGGEHLRTAPADKKKRATKSRKTNAKPKKVVSRVISLKRKVENGKKEAIKQGNKLVLDLVQKYHEKEQKSTYAYFVKNKVIGTKDQDLTPESTEHSTHEPLLAIESSNKNQADGESFLALKESIVEQSKANNDQVSSIVDVEDSGEQDDRSTVSTAELVVVGTSHESSFGGGCSLPTIDDSEKTTVVAMAQTDKFSSYTNNATCVSNVTPGAKDEFTPSPLAIKKGNCLMLEMEEDFLQRKANCSFFLRICPDEDKENISFNLPALIEAPDKNQADKESSLVLQEFIIEQSNEKEDLVVRNIDVHDFGEQDDCITELTAKIMVASTTQESSLGDLGETSAGAKVQTERYSSFAKNGTLFLNETPGSEDEFAEAEDHHNRVPVDKRSSLDTGVSYTAQTEAKEAEKVSLENIREQVQRLEEANIETAANVPVVASTSQRFNFRAGHSLINRQDSNTNDQTEDSDAEDEFIDVVDQNSAGKVYKVLKKYYDLARKAETFQSVVTQLGIGYLTPATIYARTYTKRELRKLEQLVKILLLKSKGNKPILRVVEHGENTNIVQRNIQGLAKKDAPLADVDSPAPAQMSTASHPRTEASQTAIVDSSAKPASTSKPCKKGKLSKKALAVKSGAASVPDNVSDRRKFFKDRLISEGILKLTAYFKHARSNEKKREAKKKK